MATSSVLNIAIVFEGSNITTLPDRIEDSYSSYGRLAKTDNIIINTVSPDPYRLLSLYC